MKPGKVVGKIGLWGVGAGSLNMAVNVKSGK